MNSPGFRAHESNLQAKLQKAKRICVVPSISYDESRRRQNKAALSGLAYCWTRGAEVRYAMFSLHRAAPITEEYRHGKGPIPPLQ